MVDYILDFLVILLFLYVSRRLWVYSGRKSSQGKLFFRTISLFFIIHLILFPVLYTLIINMNPKSISINENIITKEREEKLKISYKTQKRIQRKIDFEKSSISKNSIRKNYASRLLRSNKSLLDSLIWKEIDDNRVIFLDSHIIRAYTQYKIIPEDDVYKVVEVYNLDGEKITELTTFSEKELLSEILFDCIIESNKDLKELESEKKNMQEEIKTIKSNAFWSYRQILPYTLNILFTSNFNPISSLANIVNAIHNILIVCLLFPIIASIFQYHRISEKKTNN